MSLLSSVFNRGVLGAKCKTTLKLVISRIKLLRNKREVLLVQMRKEIAQFLRTGQESIARIRVEHVIREQNVLAAYEILELFCEFVFARVPILESQKECPPELQEPIASIIFAAPSCSDLPELIQIQNLFTMKYGKEFSTAASELRPESKVNRSIIEKLAVKAPAPEAKLKVLKDIAREYSVSWDSSNTEVEFSKEHEDLLQGTIRVSQKVETSEGQSSAALPSNPTATSPASFSSSSSNLKPGVSQPKPSKALSPDEVGSLQTPRKIGRVKTHTRHEIDEHTVETDEPDILAKAWIAIAAADRAAANARAAASLANIRLLRTSTSFASTRVDE